MRRKEEPECIWADGVELGITTSLGFIIFCKANGDFELMLT